MLTDILFTDMTNKNQAKVVRSTTYFASTLAICKRCLRMHLKPHTERKTKIQSCESNLLLQLTQAMPL